MDWPFIQVGLAPYLVCFGNAGGVAESKKSQKMQFPPLGVQGWPLDGVDILSGYGHLLIMSHECLPVLEHAKYSVTPQVMRKNTPGKVFIWHVVFSTGF